MTSVCTEQLRNHPSKNFEISRGDLNRSERNILRYVMRDIDIPLAFGKL